ncbi:MAG: glucose-6-phosphate isomerase, partial [Candidatus Aureabacteria bacterium]|nr:glucose-6-phosphate isomerase [Candidatus Auribacterota bacterium]
GKRCDRTGRVVHLGQTPVKALGATDQHSQIQLYMEGPFDKVITFLAVREYRTVLPLPPAPLDDAAFSYLSGHTMADLIHAEYRATALALAQAGRPNITIEIDRVDAESVGMLLYLCEMQTALAAELYGINAFDQPGVERGKELTCAAMGKRGCESLRDEMATWERRASGAYRVTV